MQKLSVKNFGPIGAANVSFGDLTILVGAQASGKSLFLQLMKLLLDKTYILNTLERYNYVINKNPDNILTNFFGEGLADVWKENTTITTEQKSYKKNSLLGLSGTKEESLFYIPAQRILSIADGRPKNFMEFDVSTPYVLRAFSETLRLFFQNGMGKGRVLFPIKNRLKGSLRNSFDQSIFHGGQVSIDERSGQKKMRMEIDGMNIPFMTWSAGQKEFMPLLMAFYCLSGPPSQIVKKENFKYIVLEEPEMGLHPQAIKAIILQVLELIQSGYKVIISTHSSVFLEFAWAFNLLKNNSKKNRMKALLEIFELENGGGAITNNLKGIFDKTVHTFYFARKDNKVHSLDISSLSAYDENIDVAEWGGLSQFAGKTSEVVAKYVSADE